MLCVADSDVTNRMRVIALRVYKKWPKIYINKSFFKQLSKLHCNVCNCTTEHFTEKTLKAQ